MNEQQMNRAFNYAYSRAILKGGVPTMLVWLLLLAWTSEPWWQYVLFLGAAMTPLMTWLVFRQESALYRAVVTGDS